MSFTLILIISLIVLSLKYSLTWTDGEHWRMIINKEDLVKFGQILASKSHCSSICFTSKVLAKPK